MRRYILRDREVVPFVGPDEAWALLVYDDDPARRVGLDRFGDVRVSTVFLGFDPWDDGPPLVFQTMVFGGPDDINGEEVRTSTWAEAVDAHDTMCVRCVAALNWA